jgi:lysyl-tRNA synthetase class 2
VAERFEVFLGGMELANGFGELTDPAEQRSRFEQDRARRMARGQRSVPLDEALLAAMEHGLPECSGVALGFDRLVMAVAGMSDISGALAFPAERA